MNVTHARATYYNGEIRLAVSNLRTTGQLARRSEELEISLCRLEKRNLEVAFVIVYRHKLLVQSYVLRFASPVFVFGTINQGGHPVTRLKRP
jgi:hypothetical protein